MGILKIEDNDIDEKFKEVYWRYNFDKEFDVGVVFSCDNEKNSSSNEEENKDRGQILLVITFLLYECN